MKKTYIAPIVTVDEAEMVDGLLVTSIQLSSESGSEEYVKELDDDDDWDIDW